MGWGPKTWGAASGALGNLSDMLAKEVDRRYKRKKDDEALARLEAERAENQRRYDAGQAEKEIEKDNTELLYRDLERNGYGDPNAVNAAAIANRMVGSPAYNALMGNFYKDSRQENEQQKIGIAQQRADETAQNHQAANQIAQHNADTNTKNAVSNAVKAKAATTSAQASLMKAEAYAKSVGQKVAAGQPLSAEDIATAHTRKAAAQAELGKMKGMKGIDIGKDGTAQALVKEIGLYDAVLAKDLEKHGAGFTPIGTGAATQITDWH